MRKRQNEMTSSSKNGEYLILGRNSDFREKFGILELEMSHPDNNIGTRLQNTVFGATITFSEANITIKHKKQFL